MGVYSEINVRQSVFNNLNPKSYTAKTMERLTILRSNSTLFKKSKILRIYESAV